MDASDSPSEPLRRIWPETDRPDCGALDVVFVHGLIGSADKTWRREKNGSADFDWPFELGKDFSSRVCPIRVWSLEYSAPVLQKDFLATLATYMGVPEKEVRAIQGEQTDIPLSLKQRAEFLSLGFLQGRGRLGDRPIVFVTHSLGGLIVKAMLANAWKNREPDPILRQTRAVVFLGTPHTGSGVANVCRVVLGKGPAAVGAGVAAASAGMIPRWLTGAAMKVVELFAAPSDTVKSLCDDNPELYELGDTYRLVVADRSIDTLSLCETKKLFGAALIVHQFSADPAVGTCIRVPDTDHATICKPESTSSPVYAMVEQVIARAAFKARAATQMPVFHQVATQILSALRKGRFPQLPRFAWERSEGPDDEADGDPTRAADPPRSLEGLPPNTPESDRDGKPGRNFRRRVVVEFYRLCEQQLADGSLKIEPADAAAAALSQFDIDKLILIAYRKQRLARSLEELSRLISEQCGHVRSTYEPTLTVLYRAVDSLDKVLSDETAGSLTTELRLVRRAIERRSQSEEQIDQDGITRERIDELLGKLQLLSQVTGQHPRP